MVKLKKYLKLIWYREYILIFTNNIAYIPLFATAIVAGLILILLISVKHKKTAGVSFVLILSDLIVLCSSLFCAVKLSARRPPDGVYTFFISSICIAAFILIPYLIMLATFEPKENIKLVPPYVNKKARKALEEAKKQEKEEEEKKATELSQGDEALLNISRDFMVKSTQSFTEENGLSLLLDYINKTIKEEVKADGSAILLVDDFDDVITVKAFDGEFPPPYKLPSDMPHKPIRIVTNFKFASFALHDNIFGEIATAGKPELITKPELDSRIYQNGPEEFLECGSYIVSPLKVGDAVIGVIALSNNKTSALFTEEQFDLTNTLAGFAASAIANVTTVKDIIEHNEITKEAELATQIQNILKPAKLPVISGLSLGSIWTQNEGVCGDYYDVIPSRKDRISFVMSDIAGKGINSIVIMSMLRAMLRLVVNTKKSAGTILTWVNKGIAAENFIPDHFGSCALINYDPTTMTVEFSTGGTIPVYYFNCETNNFERISHTSEPIGVEKSSEYKDFVQKVKKGDIIVTYTDGVVEALNEAGQQYTRESLLRVISENCKSSGKDIANLVKADLKNFCGNLSQHDDQSLLIVKF